MRTSSALRLLGGLALAFVGAAAPGCGGGSGGGGGGGGACTIPGTLVALALEGQPTPAGGIYAAFPANAKISTASGDWTAFVADVIGGSSTRGLFVARPNGQVVKVYAKGDPCPTTNGSSGVINDFRRIWMRPNGIVVALVDLTGGSIETFLTAQVNSNGVVLNRIDAISLGDALPPGAGTGTVGTLASIDDNLIQVTDAGTIFFRGAGNTGIPGLNGIWAVSVGGTGILSVAVTGQLAPGSASHTLGYDFQGLGIDSGGQLVTYVVDVIGGETSEMFAVSSGSGAVRIAGNLSTPPGGRPFDDVYEGGPIVTGFDGLNGVVAWTGHVSGGVPNVGVFSRSVVVSSGQLTAGALTRIIGPADPLTGVGVGAIASQATLLSMENEPTRITMEVLVSGGSTDRVYVSAPSPTTLNEIFREGDAAPGGGNFLNTYPSLALTQEICAERDGTFGFTSVLTDATSGVFWAVQGCDFFAVVKDGAAAPGTGTGVFASFATPSSVSVATGNIAFRAALTGGAAPTGIFRQG